MAGTGCSSGVITSSRSSPPCATIMVAIFAAVIRDAPLQLMIRSNGKTDPDSGEAALTDLTRTAWLGPAVSST